jgi:hypothetical protein
MAGPALVSARRSAQEARNQRSTKNLWMTNMRELMQIEQAAVSGAAAFVTGARGRQQVGDGMGTPHNNGQWHWILPWDGSDPSKNSDDGKRRMFFYQPPADSKGDLVDWLQRQGRTSF